MSHRRTTAIPVDSGPRASRGARSAWTVREKAPERGIVVGKAKAYSYIRFSTPEQMKGNSFERQTQKAAEYASARGLELDTTLTFQDLGVSAYRSRNAQTGALKAFLDVVEQGDIPQGSHLLV